MCGGRLIDFFSCNPKKGGYYDEKRESFAALHPFSFLHNSRFL